MEAIYISKSIKKRRGIHFYFHLNSVQRQRQYPFPLTMFFFLLCGNLTEQIQICNKHEEKCFTQSATIVRDNIL